MRLAALALACLTLAFAACGGDDEESAGTETSTAPGVTTPRTTETAPSAAPPTSTPQSPPAPSAPADPGSGGTPAPPPATPRDTPQNDVPPPPGSPAERFERECEQNPDACG